MQTTGDEAAIILAYRKAVRENPELAERFRRAARNAEKKAAALSINR